MILFSKLRDLARKIKKNPLLSFLIFLLIVAFVTFVGVLFFDCVENCISGLIGLIAKNKILTFLGIGMGGILVALQALMSYKRAKAMEDTAKAQADAVSKTEDGQRQERLRNAIEHLGNEKDSVRLGGAYELFHLAKDAKEDAKELRQTALDILCAHIRWTTGESEYQKVHASKPSEEVQSMLRLLFVQDHEVFKGLRIELQGSWLNGANLVKARLEKAVLTRVHLQGATLMEAHLQDANLIEAYLQGASLRLAHLQKAFLIRARLQGVKLFKARLQGANLLGVHLQGANLGAADIQGADIEGGHLQGAYLFGTRLQGANLRGADMQGTNLGRAHLQGTYLFRTRLQGANLLEAHLRGCESQFWYFWESFEACIRSRIGKKTDLSGVVFAGGLTKEDMDSLVEGLSDEKANELREKLEPHIDQPESNELPEERGAITKPPYTKEEAEQWIAEYEKALSEVPKDDS